MKLQGMSPELSQLFSSFKSLPLPSPQAVQVAQKALLLLETTPYCYAEKASLYSKLAIKLRPHFLYHQKLTPLLSQFVSWIWKSAAPEAVIQRQYKTSVEYAERYTEINRAAKRKVEDCLNRPLTALDELRLLFSSLFESVDYKPSTLDTPLSLCKEVGPWMLDHLQAFHKECKLQSRELRPLGEIIEEFRDHLLIGTALDALKTASFCSTFSSNGLNWTIHEIFNRIHTLREGHEFAFPGSSAHEKKYPDCRGQIVEYRFEKQENGLFTFSIVNTRIGAAHAHEQDHLFARLFASYEEARALNRMKDYSWKHIPEEAFSPQFIKQLLHPIHAADPSNTIVEITQQIHTHLKGFASVEEFQGREHGGPNKEDVAVKTTTTWLHKRMKDPLWQKFKAFYTEREVQKLDRLLSQNHIDQTEGNFLKSQAQIILARRKSKATSL